MPIINDPGDVHLSADDKNVGKGRIVFSVGGVERAAIGANGVGTGWGTVIGGSLTFPTTTALPIGASSWSNAGTPRVVVPVIADGNGQNAGWLSADGQTLYSATGNATLYTSTDDGVTWTSRHTFSGSIKAVRELPNGEVLVSVSLTPGELWLSNGWKASPSTATWSKVLTASASVNYFHDSWGFSFFSDILLVNEYGTVKDGVSNARYCWMSRDYGKTWTIIFDLAGSYADGSLLSNRHIHGVAYDPWWARIWITTGDVTKQWYFSDDLGVTWSTVAGTPKCTTILPMEKAILFLSDGPPNGVSRIKRGISSANANLVIDTAYRIDNDAVNTNALGTAAFYRRDYPGAPAFLNFNTDTIAGPGRILATLDGIRIYQVWADSITYTGKGMIRTIGPTNNGYVLGTLEDGRQSNMSRAKFHSAQLGDGYEAPLAHLGLLRENFPRADAYNSQAMTSGATGDFRYAAIQLPKGDVVTNLWCICSVIAATVTTMKMAIYDKTTLLPLASSGNVALSAACMGATGLAKFPLSTLWEVPETDGYYIALVIVATTAGSVARAGGLAVNAADPAGSGFMRLAGNVAAQTDLMSPMTLGLSTNVIWVATS